MVKQKIVWIVPLLIAMLMPNAAVADEVDPARVDAAIARAVKYLYGEQNRQGNWESKQNPTGDSPHSATSGQWGGTTALVTYALLAAGEDPGDPRIQKAVDFLKSADIAGNYALGMRAQVWLYLPNDEEAPRFAKRDGDLLFSNIQKQGKARGLYDYVAPSSRIDMSVSQFGALGMWAAGEFVEVPPGYWVEVQDAWLRWQHSSGGWAYKGRPDGDKPITASMTAAGIATLYLAQDVTAREAGVVPRGNFRNPPLEKAQVLAIEALPQLLEQGPRSPRIDASKWRYYTLYGFERIGVASGFKYFGDVDWYAAGANYLLKKQRSNGRWDGSLPDSCFALLFLARGRETVLANKAAYKLTLPNGRSMEGDWNQRPRDLAKLARWVGKQTERTLNWQILDMEQADTGDLHDAPLLYFAGDQPLMLAEAELAKIRQYVLEGGTLIFNADARNKRFEDAAKELVTTLFTDDAGPGWEWRPLPAEHPIYVDQQYNVSTWRRRPNVQSYTNGIRELALILPNDPAAAWQQNSFRADEEAFQLAANVYSYAIDRSNTFYKGDGYLAEIDASKKPKKTLTVHRVRHDGNWNPEPLGWEQLAAVMNNEYDASLTTEAVDVADLNGGEQKLAHLTGIDKLPPEAIEALAKFVRDGGTLIIDAAAGSGEFASSIERELAAAVGEQAVGDLDTPLPRSHPLFDDTPGELPSNLWRPFAIRRITGSLNQPRLRLHELDGRPAIIYSPDDLTSGLVGHPVDGIQGYTPAAAQTLMAKSLLHASGE